jgi:hypothetical protein
MPSKKERELAASWEELMKKHSRPLEGGAKAKGVSILAKKPKPVRLDPSINPSGPLPARYVVGSGTKPNEDQSLIDAKRSIAHRVGQSFNKGGLSYLTDDELKEQTTGAHLRR